MVGRSGNSFSRIGQLFALGQAAPNSLAVLMVNLRNASGDTKQPFQSPLRLVFALSLSALKRPCLQTIRIQGPAFLHHPLIHADGFAHNRAIADTPLAISAIRTTVRALHLAFANVLPQTVARLNAACPGSTFVVEACLIGLRRFDAAKPICRAVEDQGVARR